jgi:hypothetical protein
VQRVGPGAGETEVEAVNGDVVWVNKVNKARIQDGASQLIYIDLYYYIHIICSQPDQCGLKGLLLTLEAIFCKCCMKESIKVSNCLGVSDQANSLQYDQVQ